jgi:type VI secretion system protein ImpC
MQVPSIPFKILALAPFTLQEQAGRRTGTPMPVVKADLDRAITEMDVSAYIPLPERFKRIGGLTVTFRGMKDFHPDNIARSNRAFQSLLQVGKFVREAGAQGLSHEDVAKRLRDWADLPVELRIDTSGPQAKAVPTSLVDDILKMVSLPEGAGPTSLDSRSLAGQVDDAIQQLFDSIFSNPDFRTIEASWRGLKLLLSKGCFNGEPEVSIVPVSHDTLEATLDGMMAHMLDDLPSLMLVDLEFDNSPRSLDLLDKIGQFAETLMVPTICWLSHRFFHLDSWDDLGRLQYLPHAVEEQPFARWVSMRKEPSLRWLAVTCNRFLARYPYGPGNAPREVRFDEKGQLWISPVWAVGCLIGQSVIRTGWPTRFSDWTIMRIEDLALHQGAGGRHLPTEIHFPEDRIHQLIKVGITPLASIRDKDIAFIPADTTIHGDAGSLAYQLMASTVTHFLLWCKDNLSKSLSPAEIEKALEEAFLLLWAKTGSKAPQDLHITAHAAQPDSPVRVKIEIAPGRSILQSGEKLEFELNW